MPQKIFNNIFKGKTVLVTGHTGFIGSWLTLMAKHTLVQILLGIL